MQSAHNIPEFKIGAKGLVVDDDPIWQDVFARYLTDSGLMATKASSLREADDLLAREFFHVALVDLSLIENDNQDGLKVLEKIYWELGEGTAGILLTAYGTVEEGAAASSYGAKVMSKTHASNDRTCEAIKAALDHALKTLSEYRVGLNLLGGPSSPMDKMMYQFTLLQVMLGGYAKANEFASRLFKDLYPVLRLRHSAEATIAEGEGLVYGRYWSKMLGCPFHVLIGKSPSIEAEIKKFQLSPEKYGDGNDEKILKVQKEDDLAAIIFRAKAPEFEAFEPRQDPSFQSIGGDRDTKQTQ